MKHPAPEAQRVGRFSRHAVQRVRERLGFDLSASEAARAWESIEAGIADYVGRGAVRNGGAGHLYRIELHGVRCGAMVGRGVVVTVISDEDVEVWLQGRRGTRTQARESKRRARRRAWVSRLARESER